MRVIECFNVNGAWPIALQALQKEGTWGDSRNGKVLVHPMPVTTLYRRPWQRVIFDPVRDANPMFHLHEALWMLAGRDDATYLDQFISDFSARFAEEGGVMHGAYGKRWNGWFQINGKRGNACRDLDLGSMDQLTEVIRLLKKDPNDRQAVIQMWDPTTDLGVPGLKDRPCNQQILLRADRGFLDMTVTCRSNDAVYGCYGANVVHFSVLQEYLARAIGIPMGFYYQVSNNFHMYEWSKKNVDFESAIDNAVYDAQSVYPGTLPIVENADTFINEVKFYLDQPTLMPQVPCHNPFLLHTALPMWQANAARKEKRWVDAMEFADSIQAPDWRQATLGWLERRAK